MSSGRTLEKYRSPFRAWDTRLSSGSLWKSDEGRGFSGHSAASVQTYLCAHDSLLSIQKITGGGRPAGGRHCNTNETPFCTAMASFLSFDHRGDPVSHSNDKRVLHYSRHASCLHRSYFISGPTGLPDDNFVGDCGAVVVVGRALVRPLISLGLFSADVNDQSSRTGLHQDFGVFLDIEVGPISCPRKTRTR